MAQTSLTSSWGRRGGYGVTKWAFGAYVAEDLDLTAREREVLTWVARGKTNPEIAELLWVAPSTVRKHLENVYAKLGVKTRTAAVASFLGTFDTRAGQSFGPRQK
jgi:DNA-binding CsgD family transcriptional regulator